MWFAVGAGPWESLTTEDWTCDACGQRPAWYTCDKVTRKRPHNSTIMHVLCVACTKIVKDQEAPREYVR